MRAGSSPDHQREHGRRQQRDQDRCRLNQEVGHARIVSRDPKRGDKVSIKRGSLGSFILSIAGQPVSVNQTGFMRGTQAVGTACSTPPIRS